MLRTQISLTAQQRELLDVAAARAGRSISALIRDAVDVVYGAGGSFEDDLAAMRRGLGSWADRDLDGAGWVDEVRSARRLENGA